MVSFKRLLAAATACILAVQAVPTQHDHSDSLQARSVDPPDAIEPSATLQKRVLRDMQMHWANNGMITVLAGAYLSTQLADAMRITHNSGVPGDQLWQSLKTFVWSAGSSFSGAKRGRLIRIFNGLTLERSVYWARTTFHTDFGFVMQLNPDNWNNEDLQLVRDFIKQWAADAGSSIEQFFQSDNDYARNTLNNPFNPRKRGIERRSACSASYNMFEEQSAPINAVPWSLYQSGDHCDTGKWSYCPAFPSCKALLKRSLVKRALEMQKEPRGVEMGS